MTPAGTSERDSSIAAFLAAFDDGDFFDAHEILEQFWVSYRGDDRDFYKGLIQAAVALHHESTGNEVGARGVGARARGLLAPYAPRHASVDVDAVLARLPPA
jgi:predicted metal-dependent hydrolase